MKMEQTECSETSAYKTQTPGNHPEESIQQRVLYLRTYAHLLHYIAEFFSKREMFQMKAAEDIKFTFCVTCFNFENYAFCELMWINKVEADGP
jgi:hypothetical protein